MYINILHLLWIIPCVSVFSILMTALFMMSGILSKFEEYEDRKIKDKIIREKRKNCARHNAL